MKLSLEDIKAINVLRYKISLEDEDVVYYKTLLDLMYKLSNAIDIDKIQNEIDDMQAAIDNGDYNDGSKLVNFNIRETKVVIEFLKGLIDKYGNS